MRKWLISLGISISIIYCMGKYINSLNKELSTYSINMKAFDSELSLEQDDRARVFLFRIELLNYLNDSIVRKLNETRRELLIRDKLILSLSYTKSEVVKSDTITLTDTIFRDISFKLDTLVGDKWFSNKVELIYPSTIITTPTFTLETLVFTYTKKETVNPPKKFFMSRWFQKKHLVTEIIVLEDNPYVDKKLLKFILIIR